MEAQREFRSFPTRTLEVGLALAAALLVGGAGGYALRAAVPPAGLPTSSAPARVQTGQPPAGAISLDQVERHQASERGWIGEIPASTISLEDVEWHASQERSGR